MSHDVQRAFEIVRDERARLLRAHVVGVVVAARERIRSDQDAPLDFGAEAGRARALVHLVDVGAVDAQAVTHAVETREIRRALRRSDQIVRRKPMLGGRQFDFDQLLRQALRGRDTPARRAASISAPSPAVANSLTMPMRRPERSLRRCARRRLERTIDRGRIHRIVTAHRVVGERGVFDRACERPDLIEARRERDQAVPRDPAVGRFEADEIAEGAGLANRTAGVAARTDRRFIGTQPLPPIRRSNRRARARDRTDCASRRALSSRTSYPSRIHPCSSCRSGRSRRRVDAQPRLRCTARPSARESCCPRSCAYRPDTCCL